MFRVQIIQGGGLCIIRLTLRSTLYILHPLYTMVNVQQFLLSLLPTIGDPGSMCYIGQSNI